MPILFANIIPFLLWIIQKIAKRTGRKATYFRRRLCAWGYVILFALTILEYLLRFLNGSINEHFQITEFIVWGFIIYSGFTGFQVIDIKDRTDVKMNRGYFYSLWEAYDPAYVVSEKSMSIQE